MAIARRVQTEDIADTHAKIPPVNNLQRTVPVGPSGCFTKRLTISLGVMNKANNMSAVAKLKIKKLMGILLYLSRQENKQITLISKSALLTRFTNWMEVTPPMNYWSIIGYK